MHPPTGTHSAQKLAILRSKIEEKKSGEGALPRPFPYGRGYPSPSPSWPSTARLRPHLPPPTISGSATVSILNTSIEYEHYTVNLSFAFAALPVN